VAYIYNKTKHPRTCNSTASMIHGLFSTQTRYKPQVFSVRSDFGPGSELKKVPTQFTGWEPLTQSVEMGLEKVGLAGRLMQASNKVSGIFYECRFGSNICSVVLLRRSLSLDSPKRLHPLKWVHWLGLENACANYGSFSAIFLHIRIGYDGQF